MFRPVGSLVVIVTLLLTALPVAYGQGGLTPWPTGGWTTSTPEEQGIKSEDITALIEGWQAQGASLDSFAIVRHGVLVAEGYAAPFTTDSLHELHSASKGVMAALVGIAIQDGLISGLDTPVLSFFPDRMFQNVDANKESMTVRDLLIMSSGFDCRSLTGGDFEGRMMASDDWAQWVLDQPLVYEPGTAFDYCNENAYLLSAIITEVTGSPALDYAQENLFDPLGITTATWLSSPEGISLGWMGLKITTRDLAKLGYLYLSEGMWDGQQILPADFIHEAMTGQIDTGWPDYQYGYQLWSTISTGSSVAIGMGGQYLFLVPSSDLVVVLTEGGYPCEVFPMTQSYPFGYQIAGFPVVEEALPANAAAFEVLQQAISRFETPLTVEVPPLPDMVQQISGLTYNLMRPPLFTHWMDSWTIESNLDTKAVQLTFDESSEATLSVVWANDEIWNVPVGLDGIYRVSSSPMGQVGVKGFWLTEDTFRVYVKIIGEIALFQLDFHFKPSIVQITSVEVARATSSVIAGLQQE